MSDFFASPALSPSARAGRQSFSGSPVVRSPPIPIPTRRQKIRRSASFSFARRDSGFVGSDFGYGESGSSQMSDQKSSQMSDQRSSQISDQKSMSSHKPELKSLSGQMSDQNSSQKSTPHHQRRPVDFPSFALTPASPDDLPPVSRHLKPADSVIPKLWLPGDNDDDYDNAFGLPSSTVFTPPKSPSSRSPRCRLRRLGVVRPVPSSNESEDDEYDDALNGDLFVPSARPRPASPGIPIPGTLGDVGDSRGDVEANRRGVGGGRRERIESAESFEFVEMPGENDAVEVTELQESLQYHLALSSGEGRGVVERRAPIMFVPPLCRRASHLAGSPSPWRKPSSLVHRPSGKSSVERDTERNISVYAGSGSGLGSSSNVPALVPSRNVSALVSTRHRHPSLDGDSSLGDEVNSDRSLEDKASGHESIESGADSARGTSAAESQGSSGAQGSTGDDGQRGAGNGAQGGTGNGAQGGARNVTQGGAGDGSQGSARGVLNGAGDGGGRDLPHHLLPSQSERHLPDIVPRNDRRFSAPAHFDIHHPMARQIGVELCRIADEIEAQFVEEEGAVGPALPDHRWPRFADDDEDMLNALGEDGVNVLRASASAPSAVRRFGSSLRRRFSDWNCTARHFQD